jgi:hypothetical protein
MAKATKRSAVVLELTWEEAQFLCDLTSSVGGDPERTYRSLADHISGLLEDTGAEVQGNTFVTGSVWAKERS